MGDGVPFLGVAALTVVGLVWLAGYLYGLYWLAYRLGEKFRSRRWPWAAYAIVVAGVTVLSSFTVWIPADPFTRFFIGLVVFVAHAHPLLVGIWVANERARREDHKVWHARTEAWLSDWERTPKD